MSSSFVGGKSVTIVCELFLLSIDHMKYRFKNE